MGIRHSPFALVVGAVILLTRGTRGAAAADSGPDLLKGWLDAAALPSGGGGLSELTSLPFEFRTTNKKKSCEGVVTKPAAFVAWTKCFRRAESLLLDDFKNGRELELPSPSETPPKEFASFAKNVKVAGSWKDATFVGDGFFVWLRYLVTKDGKIAALLLDSGFYE